MKLARNNFEKEQILYLVLYSTLTGLLLFRKSAYKSISYCLENTQQKQSSLLKEYPPAISFSFKKRDLLLSRTYVNCFFITTTSLAAKNTNCYEICRGLEKAFTRHLNEVARWNHSLQIGQRSTVFLSWKPNSGRCLLAAGTWSSRVCRMYRNVVAHLPTKAKDLTLQSWRFNGLAHI